MKRVLLIALALVALATGSAIADPAPQPFCEDVGTITGAHWQQGGTVETIPGTSLVVRGDRKAVWSSDQFVALVSVVVQTAPGQFSQLYFFGENPDRYRVRTGTLHSVTVCVI